MTFFDRLRVMFSASPASEPSKNYCEAIKISNDLIDKMRRDQDSANPIIALMADIWMHRHNMPYQTTVFEAVQEVEAAVAWSDIKMQRDRS